jgi:hypothetical protein
VTRLFRRAVQLTLSKPQAGLPEQGYFTQSANAVVIGDDDAGQTLRVTFSIEKNLGTEPNGATVTVYNLSEAGRAEIQKKPLHVRLDAGYDGDIRRLFVGDLRFGSAKLDGVDWMTRLELADGLRARKYARARKSYPPGVSQRAVLGDVVKAMGLKVPKSVDDAKELLGAFASGVATDGPAHAEMTRLLQPHGLGWSVQDGQLQILRENGVRADEAIVVSQDTGMIGSPEFEAPKRGKRGPSMRVRMLLEPRLQPGGRIKLESLVGGGLFKVERVRHTGDTHGSDWYSDVEAKPL